jgi:hypothetical protein
MLSEIRLMINQHEVLMTQKTDGATDFIVLPKATAINVAREILKAFPEEALKQLFEDLKNK